MDVRGESIALVRGENKERGARCWVEASRAAKTLALIRPKYHSNIRPRTTKTEEYAHMCLDVSLPVIHRGGKVFFAQTHRIECSIPNITCIYYLPSRFYLQTLE